jgi:ketosteroid isomerase-like protein
VLPSRSAVAAANGTPGSFGGDEVSFLPENPALVADPCCGQARFRSKTMTNDIDELTALNLDFVASAQNSDVRRFDEILAPEFYCSNPDKSLVDRAAFLEQTAKPVAIKNLQAHDVKIRIMGHFAIIHAATSYTTPDGQQAHGRYTDCWAKQNGKWLAVSAHVTR